MMLRYHTVNSITNGVQLTRANVGRQVEWVAVLKDLGTGEIHRVNQFSGIYEGDFSGIYEGDEVDQPTLWLYARFTCVLANGQARSYVGVPKAFFTLAENHPRTQDLPEPQTYPKGHN